MKYKKSITILVIFIVVLSIIASLGGIFLNGGQGQHEFKSIYGETIKYMAKGYISMNPCYKNCL